MKNIDLQRGDYSLSELWEQLRSTEYRVVDEQGVNVANATVRHFHGDLWLYQDDTDGYSLHEQDEVEDWRLNTMDQPKLGWDVSGNVIQVD